MTLDHRQLQRIAAVANPQRFKLARDANGWTQAQLVEHLDGALTTGAISQIENGRVRPSAKTVAALSDALGFPPTFFVRREDDVELVGFFRSLRSTPARARAQALAHAQLLHDFAVAIERHVRLPDLELPVLASPLHDRDAIEIAAERVRDRWALGDKPIEHMVRLLERKGIVVARLAVERSDVDAFSVQFEDRPVVILGDDKAVTARSRFDAAHELAHLMAHEPDQAGAKSAELEAHAFAGAFLLPADAIGPRLPKTADWRRLLDLKAEWGVSLAALLMRARSLGVLSEHAYINAVKAMSARGWRRSEPGDELLGRPERPALLRRAVHLLSDGGTSLDQLATDAGLAPALLRRFVGDLDERPRVRL